MKYSLFKNMIYVHKLMFHYNKKLKFFIALHILLSTLIPIFTTIIPAIAVGLITYNLGVKPFIIVMTSIVILYSIIIFTNQYLDSRLNTENTFVRLTEFYLPYTLRLMQTDYINVEPQNKQITIQKALNSLSSNWVGPEFLMKNTPVFIINSVGLIIYSSLISSLNYLIILILLAMTLLNYFLMTHARNYEEKHKKTYVKYDRQIDYLYQNSTSLINGKDARIYQMENWFSNIFQVLIKKRNNWTRRMNFRYFIPSVSDQLLLFLRDIIAYGILIQMVLDHKLDITTFVFFIGIIGGFSYWLNNAVTAYSNLKRANLGVNDFRASYESENIFNHGTGCELPKENETPITIEFRNVSFRYPGEEKYTLKNINIQFKGAEKIALVGINGAGKTTLVKLLSGLYYPTQGDIYVNGKSIKEYNIDEYYQLIGVVFQDVEILPFTIAKNVASCNEQFIDYDKVNKSLTLAGLGEKIQSLKMHEQTYLTQILNKDGILLSGGEMQKLMLARALYKNAAIMILDEPTAALDPIAESEIYEKFNELTKDKTSLFISHRLSSTKFCDRILFLENGEIIEDGNHDELMSRKGRYKEMFDIQSHYYKDKVEEEKNNEI